MKQTTFKTQTMKTIILLKTFYLFLNFLQKPSLLSQNAKGWRPWDEQTKLSRETGAL